jgi:hypothetical protein
LTIAGSRCEKKLLAPVSSVLMAAMSFCSVDRAVARVDGVDHDVLAILGSGNLKDAESRNWHVASIVQYDILHWCPFVVLEAVFMI